MVEFGLLGFGLVLVGLAMISLLGVVQLGSTDPQQGFAEISMVSHKVGLSCTHNGAQSIFLAAKSRLLSAPLQKVNNFSWFSGKPEFVG